MYFRRSSIIRYLLAVYIGAAMYSELFVYYMQRHNWVPLECLNENEGCMKILFIADPQIQGDRAAPSPFHQIFSWDSDRYLKTTFQIVLNYFKPDVLVYLGDLMDEGSISTSIEYHKYVKRLAGIFDVHYPIMQVWLPGDNDIGGENEPVKQSKIREFDRIFDQPPVINIKNASFFIVNAITHTIPDKEFWPKNDTSLKIALSHYPVTIRGAFGQKVNNEIRPDIYFCAHEHESKYVKQSKDLDHKQYSKLEYGDKILDVDFTEDSLYEIYVPTCSYRMGTSKIGFGAAVLDNNNKNMRYTVFWSPKRFHYLIGYLVLICFPLIYLIVFCTAKLIYGCSRTPAKTVKGSDKVALLEKV